VTKSWWKKIGRGGKGNAYDRSPEEWAKPVSKEAGRLPKSVKLKNSLRGGGPLHERAEMPKAFFYKRW